MGTEMRVRLRVRESLDIPRIIFIHSLSVTRILNVLAQGDLKTTGEIFRWRSYLKEILAVLADRETESKGLEFQAPVSSQISSSSS